MKCALCGADHLPGDDECPDCGASLTQEELPRPRTVIEQSLAVDRVAVLQPHESVSIPQRASLALAVELMRERRIGCLLATGDDGSLTGILSEGDLLKKAAGTDLDLEQCTVAELMTPAPETIRPEDGLAVALQRMAVGDHRYLPLVDAEQHPMGVISSRDIINYLESALHRLGT